MSLFWEWWLEFTSRQEQLQVMQKMTHWTKVTYVCQGKNIFPRAFQSLTKCSYFLITFWLQIKRIIVAELQA